MTEQQPAPERILEAAVFPDTGRVVPEIGAVYTVREVTPNVLDFHDGRCTVVTLERADLSVPDEKRLVEIRERWANILPMDCGTSYEDRKGVAHLYEKESPYKRIATMADLYDMPRLNALAKSKDDIDYLLSLLQEDMPRRWCSVHRREEFKYESLEHELAAPLLQPPPAASERCGECEKCCGHDPAFKDADRKCWYKVGEKPCGHRCGRVTLGRIVIDRENETETFIPATGAAEVEQRQARCVHNVPEGLTCAICGPIRNDDPPAARAEGPRSNLERHLYQEHPHYPNYCPFAVGDEDYCKREPDNEIHLSDDIDQHGRRIPFIAPTAAPPVETQATETPLADAWREWFQRAGEHATAEVVNATATLVIAERQALNERIRASTTTPGDAAREAAPCPCCAWLPQLLHDHKCFADGEGWKLRCDKCGLQTCWWHKKAEVLEHWNARHFPPTAPAESEAPDGFYWRGRYEALKAKFSEARTNAIAECVRFCKSWEPTMNPSPILSRNQLDELCVALELLAKGEGEDDNRNED